MNSLVREIEVHSLIKDPATVGEYHQQYQREVVAMSANATELAPIATTPGGKEFLLFVNTTLPRLADLNERIYAKAAGGDVPGAVAIYKQEFIPLEKQFRDLSDRFAEAQNAAMVETASSGRSVVAQASWLTSAMVLLSIVVAAIVIFMMRQINRDLRETATSLSEGAEQIAAAATQVSSSSQSLAQGASQQAASIEETSASTEEINSMARRNTENSNATAAMVSESQIRFEETDSIAKSQAGKLKVDQVATAIRSITAASSKMKILVDEINLGSQEQSKGIDQISRTIHEMERVTQGNAANAEQSAAAAEQLTAQSQAVRDIVEHLNALIGSPSGPTHNPLRPSIHRVAASSTRPAFRKALSTVNTAVHLPGTAKSSARGLAGKPNKFETRSAFPLDDEEFREFKAF